MSSIRNKTNETTTMPLTENDPLDEFQAMTTVSIRICRVWHEAFIPMLRSPSVPTRTAVMMMAAAELDKRRIANGTLLPHGSYVVMLENDHGNVLGPLVAFSQEDSLAAIEDNFDVPNVALACSDEAVECLWYQLKREAGEVVLH